MASDISPAMVELATSKAGDRARVEVCDMRALPALGELIEEVAIASASHLARPEQLAAVRSLLAKAPADEDELECGPEPTRLEHNCSGKHAGMLALCRAHGWASGGYRARRAVPCPRA